jgi:hypothetical protein
VLRRKRLIPSAFRLPLRPLLEQVDSRETSRALTDDNAPLADYG